MKVEPIRDIDLINEIKRWLLRKNYRNYFLFHFSINTGLRIGDTLKLKVKDVRGKRRIWLIEEKTEKQRSVPINPMIFEDVYDYTKDMDPEDYLFPSRQGKDPLTRVQAYRIMKQIQDHFEISDPVGCHTLRKSFGYHFYKRTKDVALLQEIFNHSDPSVTLRYIGINADTIEKAYDDFYI